MADQKGAGETQDKQGITTTGPDPEVAKWQDKARRYEAQVVDFEKRFKDIDPDRFQAAIEENRILQRQLAEKDGSPEKIEEVIEREKADLEKRFSTKYQELESDINKLKQQNRYLRVTKEMMTEATSYFNSRELDLLEPIVDRFCDWSEEGGKIIIKDEKGHPRYSKTNPRELMTSEEFFGELVERYPALALPKGKGGTMRQGETNGVSGENMTPEKYLGLSPEQRASLSPEVNEKMAGQIFNGKRS